MQARVLIVIDLLNDFLDPKGALFCGDEARKIILPVKQRILEFRKNGGHVIFLCDAHAPDDLEFAMFAPHAVKGTWGAEIIKEIKELLDEGDWYDIIEKTRYSGFYGTNLEETLNRMGIPPGIPGNPVEVAGVCTSICVMDTVGDLINRHIHSIVQKSLVADFNPEAQSAAFSRMRDIYGATIAD
ncbi:MAG: cysteine hydrolase [Deltaproteobacteria bacterium]|nr:cysteine hydrolase [Deltaproteobacteria bacterium]